MKMYGKYRIPCLLKIHLVRPIQQLPQPLAKAGGIRYRPIGAQDVATTAVARLLSHAKVDVGKVVEMGYADDAFHRVWHGAEATLPLVRLGGEG